MDIPDIPDIPVNLVFRDFSGGCGGVEFWGGVVFVGVGDVFGVVGVFFLWIFVGLRVLGAWKYGAGGERGRKG